MSRASRKTDRDQVARYADMFSAMGTEARLRIVQRLLTAHPEGLVLGEIQGEPEFLRERRAILKSSILRFCLPTMHAECVWRERHCYAARRTCYKQLKQFEISEASVASSEHLEKSGCEFWLQYLYFLPDAVPYSPSQNPQS